MNSSSLHAIASVAYKEFLHIYRDRRVLLLLLILPPLFVLLFGHAFETSEISDVPAMLINRDNNSRTQRFIDYVIPGIIGLILQLLTVTLMACTIARERESGTLYQLMVTSLKRGEIVIGKILPYLGVSIILIAVITLVAGFHFHVQFYQPPALMLICLLFLLCSLGLGLLISAFSKTQTQAIQFSVFFLLPVFVLSGAFAPLEQLPKAIQYLSEVFPLTHFCRAFRLVNMYHAGAGFYLVDLIVLFAGALVTFIGAAFLLRRIEE